MFTKKIMDIMEMIKMVIPSILFIVSVIVLNIKSPFPIYYNINGHVPKEGRNTLVVDIKITPCIHC